MRVQGSSANPTVDLSSEWFRKLEMTSSGTPIQSVESARMCDPSLIADHSSCEPWSYAI